MGVLDRIPLIIGVKQEIPAFLWRESLHHATDSSAGRQWCDKRMGTHPIQCDRKTL
jgi:hypothetical protein